MTDINRSHYWCNSSHSVIENCDDRNTNLGLSRAGRPYQHETVPNHRGFIQLDTFVNKSFNVLQVELGTLLSQSRIQLSIVNRFLLKPATLLGNTRSVITNKKFLRKPCGNFGDTIQC